MALYVMRSRQPAHVKMTAETGKHRNRKKKWDRIKGLKLRRIDAYCGGAPVHKAP